MSTSQPREQFLLISALGPNPMELTTLLCRACVESRCAVVSSRLTRHGEFSALVLQVSGAGMPSPASRAACRPSPSAATSPSA